MATRTAKLTIKSNHPARKRISDLPNYMESKGEALSAIDDILNDYGIELGRSDMDGDEGSNTFALRVEDNGHVRCDKCDDCGEFVNVVGYNNLVSISWYRMPSGRYEIVAYIS